MKKGFDIIKNLDNMQLFFEKKFQYYCYRHKPNTIKIYIDDPVHIFNMYTKQQLIDMGVGEEYYQNIEKVGDILAIYRAKRAEHHFTDWDDLTPLEILCVKIFQFPKVEMREDIDGPNPKNIYDVRIEGAGAGVLSMYVDYFAEVGKKKNERAESFIYGQIAKEVVEEIETFLDENNQEYLGYYDGKWHNKKK